MRAAVVMGSVLAMLAGLSPAVAHAAVVDVSIENYQFLPREVSIHVGDTVRWINREKRSNHSVLFVGPPVLESERMFPEETWQRTFDQAGDYPYSCGPHPDMKGSVHVGD